MKCGLKRIVMVLAGFCLALPLFGRLAIRDLKFQQRWPWNGVVDISYRIECDDKNQDGTPVDVLVTLSGYERDRNRTIALKTLIGDGVGQPLKAGGPYRLMWLADTDYPDFHAAEFVIRASAKTKPKPYVSQPGATGTYLVIDLSRGKDAETYPYRNSETGPDLFDGRCRTTELWLRRIPAGTFMMGCANGRSYESLHQVTLKKEFYIGIFEVTQNQWELVMGSNPSKYKGGDRPVEAVSYGMIRGTHADAGAGWPEYGHRVDASSFLGKLQAKTGLVFDLPTEAQWEYACRAGTTTDLNSGEDFQDQHYSHASLDKLGRYVGNRIDGKGGYAEHTRVGSYLPNSWGLYDMHGNVWEWCLDWYMDNIGTVAVTEPEGPSKGAERVVRGGCWSYEASVCRSACRTYQYEPDSGGSSLKGFRITVQHLQP